MNEISLFGCMIIIVFIHFRQTFSELRTISDNIKSKISKSEKSISCSKNNKQNNPVKSNANVIRNYDTLSQDDVVKQQYAMLPYPEVKPGEFENIRRHYNSDHKNIPMLIAPAVTLENINHFLFRGRNDFR